MALGDVAHIGIARIDAPYLGIAQIDAGDVEPGLGKLDRQRQPDVTQPNDSYFRLARCESFPPNRGPCECFHLYAAHSCLFSQIELSRS